MRIWTIWLAAFVLVAAAPAGRPALVLAGDGIAVGARTVKFDRATRAQAMALATSALGAPIKQGNRGDCGGDAVLHYTQFRGGFELTFVRGKFVGWSAENAGVRTSRGIQVGASLAAVRRAYPDIGVNESEEDQGGLGANFQREGGPNGWLDGTRPASTVTGLYAGATCIVG